MKLLIHDYAGHPFPVQLSRILASRGHEVLHLYAGYNKTPRGELHKKPTDPNELHIEPIYIKEPLQKYNFMKRWFQEREYGDLLSKQIRNNNPDIVISAQTPLDAQVEAQKASQEIDAKFVFWLQDIIGTATYKLLKKKLSFIGKIIGNYYINKEQSILRKSDHIILITSDFFQVLNSWGINIEKTSVIPNWAPIEYLSPLAKNNSWSRKYSLQDSFNFIYTGTLGLKHNPELLLDLALKFEPNRDVNVIVVSEGPGADWLGNKKAEYKLDNIILLPFQPFDVLQKVMGTADVLVALLEGDAGVFSVPSKVLTYLCARRPLLLAVPPENLASKIVNRNKAGIVVAPDKRKDFLQGAKYLWENQDACKTYGKNGRKYAENTFEIDKIADQFEEILRENL